MKAVLGLLALASGVAIAAPAKAPPQQIVVDLTLTPRAAARLADLNEGITISAMYGGEATKARARQADDMGEIWLGMDRKTVVGKAQRVIVPVKTIRRDRFSWVVGGQPKLLINIFTARQRLPNNLITCDIFDGPLADGIAQPIKIACDLIGGS